MEKLRAKPKTSTRQRRKSCSRLKRPVNWKAVTRTARVHSILMRMWEVSISVEALNFYLNAESQNMMKRVLSWKQVASRKRKWVSCDQSNMRCFIE